MHTPLLKQSSSPLSRPPVGAPSLGSSALRTVVEHADIDDIWLLADYPGMGAVFLLGKGEGVADVAVSLIQHWQFLRESTSVIQYLGPPDETDNEVDKNATAPASRRSLAKPSIERLSLMRQPLTKVLLQLYQESGLSDRLATSLALWEVHQQDCDRTKSLDLSITRHLIAWDQWILRHQLVKSGEISFVEFPAERMFGASLPTLHVAVQAIDGFASFAFISLSICTGAGTGILTGKTVQQVKDGRASFSDLNISQGDPLWSAEYSLQASTWLAWGARECQSPKFGIAAATPLYSSP